MKASEWQTVQDVEQWVYASYLRAKDRLTDTLDEKVRRPQLTRLLLDRLASPDRSGYNVVVAGSKGKGSTSVMLAEILRQHGWRVGLFTSPHLICFTERIRLNGDVISDGDFVRLARRVKEVADPIAERLAEHEYVSPVGLAAVMAALYFHEQGTDVNIWECGRGALFDDVNQVVHQEAVITPILSEHLTQLGPDWQEVVRHKLGVVTSTVRHVYIGKQDPQVEREIRRRTGGWKELEIVWAGRDVCVSGVHTGMRGTAFTVQTERGRYEKLMVPLIGEFQADNAALAVACAENVVQRLNPPRQRPAFRRLTHSLVRTALASATWPGRMQLVSRDPIVFVDGAIHRRSAQYVAETLTRLSNRPGVLVIGIPRDKDYTGVMTVLAPLARKVIVTAADRDRGKMPHDAANVAKTFCSQVEFEEGSVEAFQLGLVDLKQDEWMAVVGTQSLVGEAVAFFRQGAARADGACR